VKGKRCILFLGAPDGAPFGYPPEQRPPVGSQLSDELALACDFATRFPREDAGNLQRVALAYELDREGGGSRAALVDAIADAVESANAPSPMVSALARLDELDREGGGSRAALVDAIADAMESAKAPSPMVSALARLDFPVVVTTNDDRLFERALRDPGKAANRGLRPEAEGRTTVHEDPTPASRDLPAARRHRRARLTRRDRRGLISSCCACASKEPCDPIPLSLKESLTKSTTLLVGYSLLDYDLRAHASTRAAA
jgi:hypothetical protein